VRAVADGGYDAGLAFAERIRTVLRQVMVLTGSASVDDLRRVPMLTEPRYTALAEQLIQTADVPNVQAAGPRSQSHHGSGRG
jgi:hypothetical protein